MKNSNRRLIKCILLGGFLLKSFGNGSMSLHAAMSPVEDVLRNIAELKLCDLFWKFLSDSDRGRLELDHGELVELQKLLQMGADAEKIKKVFRHEKDEVIDAAVEQARMLMVQPWEIYFDGEESFRNADIGESDLSSEGDTWKQYKTDVRQCLNTLNENGDALLHVLVKDDDRNKVRMLISEDCVDVNAQNRDGFSPIHLAVMTRSEDMVKLLLSCRDLNVDAQTRNEKNTALHLAVKANDPEIMNLLLRRGASMNMSNAEGIIPFDLAVQCGFFEGAALL